MSDRTLMDCAQAALMYSEEDARVIADAAEEITRLRAENIHLRRAGMDRPSAELHEAALAELRAEIERLRARVDALRWPLAVYIHAHASGSNVPPHIEAAARAALEAKP